MIGKEGGEAVLVVESLLQPALPARDGRHVGTHHETKLRLIRSHPVLIVPRQHEKLASSELAPLLDEQRDATAWAPSVAASRDVPIVLGRGFLRPILRNAVAELRLLQAKNVRLEAKLA